ncbi:hypothetical protein EON62_02800 [archaeon]|nr:MAG: hypothetical protein EON62_02800 [archaeon]
MQLQQLILQLLVKDVSKRLGCQRNGAKDVKDHRFFASVKWDKLRAKELAPPWRPKVASALDTSNFDAYDEDDRVHPYRDDGSKWDATF